MCQSQDLSALVLRTYIAYLDGVVPLLCGTPFILGMKANVISSTRHSRIAKHTRREEILSEALLKHDLFFLNVTSNVHTFESFRVVTNN